MDVLGSISNNSSCLTTRHCHLKELAVSSDWQNVLETLQHIETSECLKWILRKAVKEQQWSCVVELTKHCCVQLRNEVIREALSQSQWWVIRDLLELGISCSARDWMCKQAAELQQWDLVSEFVEVGVSSSIRASVMKAAVAQSQVPCIAKLINVGSGVQAKNLKKEVAQQVVGNSQCDFALELVKMACDEDLTDFVLREAMKQNQWKLVSELVQLELGVVQLESVCDEAVSSRQWDLVFQLLQRGVSPREWIVDELFRNKMVQCLLDLFPNNTLSSSLRGLILMLAVRYGERDMAVSIIHSYPVSDAEVMETIKSAVQLQDRVLLLQLIRCSPRSRRVFKQEFHKQLWKDSFEACDDGGEICWIFELFCAENENDLALHVATTSYGKPELIGNICVKAFDVKKKKFMHALMKLHNMCIREYKTTVKQLCKRSKADHRCLFRHALQVNEISFASRLCGKSIERKDLKFAVAWILTKPGADGIISRIIFKLTTTEAVWFRHYACQFALKNCLKNSSEINLENFSRLLNSSRIEDKTFCRHMFMSAVKKAVKLNNSDLFVHLFGHVLYASDSDQEKEQRFALTIAVSNGKLHFVTKVCQNMSRKFFLYKEDAMKTIITTVFETKAFAVFPSLSEGLKALELDERHDMFKLCLQEMLKNRETWPWCTPVINRWVTDLLEFSSMTYLRSIRESVLQEIWQESMSSLAHWCLEESKTTLAFLFGLVMEDWKIVDDVLCPHLELDLPERIVKFAVQGAAKDGAYSTGAALLKLFPVTKYFLEDFYIYRGMEELAQACQTLGLSDWTLVLSVPNWNSVKEQLETCQNQAVVDFIFKCAVMYNECDFAKELLNKCSDDSVMSYALETAFNRGQYELAERLICRVDPTTVNEDCYVDCQTLLFTAVSTVYKPWLRPNYKHLRLVRLCISSGLSVFQRSVKFDEDEELQDHNCPLLVAHERLNLPVIKLLLKSGAITHKRLDQIRNDMNMFIRVSSLHIGEDWQEGFRYTLEAAATPCRLEHLARLVVSGAIGCQPGRAERIESLPVPDLVKDLLHFKDVLSEDEECESPQ